MKKYGFYPGCSLHSSGKEYDLSCRAVAEKLDIQLEELPGWCCCGASSAHSLDHEIDLALSARNISLCHKMELEMAIPCAACYSRTAHAWQVLKDDADRRKEMEAEFEFTFREDLPVYHLLQVVEKQLAGREFDVSGKSSDGIGGNKKVVCYYGCLINRPRGINPHDDVEVPQAMERILQRCGYETLDWCHATECCGAALSLTRDDVVVDLVGRLITAAEEAGADAIATGCPLCQVNLESRQKQPFSIYYFTELIGAALDIPEAGDWENMHLVETPK